MWSTSWAHSAKASKWNGQGEASGGSEVAPAPDEPNELTSARSAERVIAPRKMSGSTRAFYS